MALKDVEVRALKARDRVYKRGDGYGLYIEVHPNGSKLWRLKYSHLGKDKRIAFGRYPEVGLAEARAHSGYYENRANLPKAVVRSEKLRDVRVRALADVPAASG